MKCAASGRDHRVQEIGYCHWCKAQFGLNHKPKESDPEKARYRSALEEIRDINNCDEFPDEVIEQIANEALEAK